MTLAQTPPKHDLAEPSDRAYHAMTMAAETATDIVVHQGILESLAYEAPPWPGNHGIMNPLMRSACKDGDRLRAEVRRERALILQQRKAIAGFLRDTHLYLAAASQVRQREIEDDDSLDPMSKIAKQAARKANLTRETRKAKEIEAMLEDD